jgi:hypothetical protein
MTPQLSLCFSPITFPLLNTIIIFEYKSFKDSYLVSSAFNLPSSVSRRSLQVLLYEFILLLNFAECLLFSLIRYSLGVRTFFFSSPWRRDVVACAWLWDKKIASVVSEKPKIRYLKRRKIKLQFRLYCRMPWFRERIDVSILSTKVKGSCSLSTKRDHSVCKCRPYDLP